MDVDEAITDLLTRCGDRLLRLAFQLTHDRSAAEDVMAQAVETVYRGWRHRQPEVAHGEAYLRRAVVNEFLRRRRLRSASEVPTAKLAEPITAGFDAEVAARDAMWRELRRLPRRQRAVVVLRYYEDLPDREIATLVGRSEATVRSLAARGLATLRDKALARPRERETS